MTPDRTHAAVYVEPGEIVVEERPVRPPGAGEVVVEISHCGVCGSDIHLMLEGWGSPNRVEGHEYSGTVAALGAGARRWRLGDNVVCGPSPRCGECPACRANLPSQCERRGRVMADEPGGFAGFVTIDERALRRIPDGLSLRAAALAEPLAVALHGITRSRVQSGQRALVFGVGPIGALTVAALHTRGVEDVGVVEPSPGRQELARRLGADPVLAPHDVPQTSPMAPEHVDERAAHVVLECSGKRAAMEAGLGMLRRGGRLVLVGAGIEPPRFDPNRILLNELTITGSFVYDHDGFEAALGLLASGAIPVDDIIEPDDVPLDRLPDTLRDLASGALAGKALIVPTLSAELRHRSDDGHDDEDRP